MAVCPNKSTPEWKLLENTIGPFNAYKLFIANGYEVPAGNQLLDFLDLVNPLYGTTYNQLTSDEIRSYNKQLADYETKTGTPAPLAMKKAIEKLLNLQTKIIAQPDGYLFKETSEKFDRATSVVQNADNGYYSFDGNPDMYENNREWGNQVDKLLTSVILGQSLQEARKTLDEYSRKNNKKILLSEAAIEQAYEILKSFRESYPDSVILSQMILFNETKKIAGTADIVIIAPDGSIKIMDLKSSLYPTNYNPDTKQFEEYQKGQFVNRYDRQFIKDGVRKASKKERHSAQLSLYKGMALSKGFVFAENNELGVIPLHIVDTINDEVQEIELEDMFFLDAQEKFIEEVYEDPEFSPEVDISKYSQYDKILEKVRKTLEERLIFLQRRRGSKYERYLIEKLKENINTIEKAKAVTRFIEDAYNIFMGTGQRNPGAVVDLRNYINEVESGQHKDPSEVITKLMSYRDTVEMFRPIITELQGFYTLEVGVGSSYAPGSPLDKLNKTVQAFNAIDKLYKDNANKLITEQLVRVNSKSANLAFVKELEQQKKKLGILPKDSRAYKAVQERIETLEREIGPDGVTYETILSALDNGSNKDIPFLDYLLSPAISSSNPIVALFAKTLKKAFENARQLSIVAGRHGAKAFETYASKAPASKDNVSAFNSPFYERITVYNGKEMVEKMSFVQDYNADAFNKAKAEMYKQAEAITDVNKKNAFINRWFAENTEALPLEDEVIINPETKEKIVILKGRNTLKKEQQKLLEDKVISQKDYERWLDRNETVINGVVYYSRDFSRPSKSKYPSPAYQAIQRDPAKKQYYDYLVSTYFKSQERIAPSNRMGFILPSIAKTNIDRLVENGAINYVKYKWQDIYKVTEKDMQSYGESVEGLKVIPVLYTNSMPADDVSVDLLSSVLLFDQASLRYEAATNTVALGEAALESVKIAPPVKTDSKGMRVISEAAKKAGIKGWDKYVKKHDQNNVAALLEAFIDTQIFGIHSIPSNVTIGGKTIEMNKLANSLMGFGAFTQIGGNPILSAANSLQANVQVAIEAVAAEYFDMGEFGWAKWEYDTHIPDYVRDFTEPVNKSLIGQLVDIYDPMQGNYTDRYGRRVTQSMWKKLWSTDTWFFLQNQGEHAIQVQTMLAMLKRTKVKQIVDGQVKEIPLIEAYEKGADGIIKLKPGIKLEGLVSDNGLVSLDVQNTLHALNKRMHGVYNSFDKVAIEKYWWGKLIMMYRKFLVPGLKKRFKSFGIDQELGNVTEGHFNTFFRIATTQTRDMFKQLSPFGESNLTDLEKKNLTKAATEMGVMLSTGLLILLLKALSEGADDEDKKLYSYGLLMTMRLNSDMSAFLIPGDPRFLFLPNLVSTFRSLKYPSASQTVIEKFIRLLGQFTDMTAVYERKTGAFEKGDSKLVAKILKLAGMNKNMFYPEEIIKMMEFQGGQ